MESDLQINSYNIIAATEENVPREGSKALPKEVKKGFNGLNLKGSRKTSGVKNSFGRKGIIWALHYIVDVIGACGLSGGHLQVASCISLPEDTEQVAVR